MIVRLTQTNRIGGSLRSSNHIFISSESCTAPKGERCQAIGPQVDPPARHDSAESLRIEIAPRSRRCCRAIASPSCSSERRTVSSRYPERLGFGREPPRGARERGRRARAAGTALNWVKSFVQNGVVCTVALPQTWYDPPGPTEPERAAVPERHLALRR